MEAPPAGARPLAQRAPITSCLATDYAGGQAKRREAALARQRAARDRTVAAARALLVGGGSGGHAGGGEAEQHQHQQQAAGRGGEHASEPSDDPASMCEWRPEQEQEAAAAGGGAATKAAPPPPLTKQERQHRRRQQQQQWYAGQAMVYDWLAASPPHDLGPRSWLVMPRPGGVRALVTSGGGATTARAARTGRPLSGALSAPFLSLLPGGGGGGGGGGGRTGRADHCALDCVCLTVAPPQQPSFAAAAAAAGPATLPPPSSSPSPSFLFVVLDVIGWRGVALAACTASARQAWLEAKAAEGEAESGLLPADGFATCRARPPPPPAGSAVAARFALAGAARASARAIAEAGGGGAAAARGWPEQEGILLLHQEGDYLGGGALGTPWPLALAWKDERCAAYLVETGAPAAAAVEGALAAAQTAAAQTATLRLVPSAATMASPPGGLLDAVTADDPPHAFVSGIDPGAGALAPGSLQRFLVWDPSPPPSSPSAQAGTALQPTPAPPPLPPGAALAHAGPAASSRLHADGLSKVLFQAMARRGTLPTLHDLVETAARNEREEAEEGAAAAAADGGGGGAATAMAVD